MAYLIDRTYFQRELRIPGLQELRSEMADLLDSYIDEHSRVVLRGALGAELFESLDDDIVNGVLSGSATDRWNRLVTGHDYILSGQRRVWKGLLHQEGAFKKSLLAYYTYPFFLKENVTELSTMGEVQGVAKNAVAVNPTQRYISMWNKFVNLYQGDYYPYSVYNRNPNVIIKRGVPFYDYTGYYENTGYVSLLTFLIENETDYPDPALKLYDYKNQLDL